MEGSSRREVFLKAGQQESNELKEVKKMVAGQCLVKERIAEEECKDSLSSPSAPTASPRAARQT